MHGSDSESLKTELIFITSLHSGFLILFSHITACMKKVEIIYATLLYAYTCLFVQNIMALLLKRKVALVCKIIMIVQLNHIHRGKDITARSNQYIGQTTSVLLFVPKQLGQHSCISMFRTRHHPSVMIPPLKLSFILPLLAITIVEAYTLTSIRAIPLSAEHRIPHTDQLRPPFRHITCVW